MSYSLESIWASIFARNGSCAGSIDNRWAKDLTAPHNLLYLERELRPQERGVRKDAPVVVLPVLDMISAQDLDFAYIGVPLPLWTGEKWPG